MCRYVVSGFVFDLEENESIICCVVVSVYNVWDEIVAVIFVVSIIMYMSLVCLEELVFYVKFCVEEIFVELGWGKYVCKDK